MQEDMSDIYVHLEYFNHRHSTSQWCIIPTQTHFIDLTYVVKGSATYIINGEKYVVNATDLLCIPQGSDRRAYCHSDDLMECYSMNFQLYDATTQRDEVLPFGLITSIGIRPHVIHLLDELYTAWLLREKGYRLKANGYILLIISELLSIMRYDHQLVNADSRVRKVVGYIMEHYSEPLNVSMLADLVHLNPIYLSSLFRKYLGTSINQCVQHIRVNYAQILLEEGTYSVTEAAGLCGFCDVYYFSRVFKMLKGLSPSSIAKH